MPFRQPSTVIPKASCFIKWQLCCALFGTAMAAFGNDPVDSPVLETTPAAETEAAIEVPMFTLVLPTWTAAPQLVQLVQPKEDDLSHFELDSHAESHADPDPADPAANEIDRDSIAVVIPGHHQQEQEEHLTQTAPEPKPEPAISPPPASNVSYTSAHLLIPQLAPPMADPVEFPEWTPASDIWFKGFAAAFEGEHQQEAGDLVAAIASFQNARSAYEMVELRFPEWQSNIVQFRLGDLERRIRQLVQKTATAKSE